MVSEDLDTLAELEFSEDLPCDFDEHSENIVWHDDGPGIWYATVKCPHCKTVSVMLMCQKVTDVLAMNSDEELLNCDDCEEAVSFSDIIVDLVRKQ